MKAEFSLLGLEDNELIRLKDDLRRAIDLGKERKGKVSKIKALQKIKALVDENDISIDQLKKFLESFLTP